MPLNLLFWNIKDQFKMSGFVDLLFQIGVNFGHSEEIPKYMIKDLTNYLLYTVGQSLNVDVANKVAKQLYDIDSHDGKKKKNEISLAEVCAIRSIISTIHDTSTQSEMEKNRGRLAEASVDGSIISANRDILFQYMTASRIGELLAEMIFSQEIKSPNLLYPHVEKAVEALHVAYRGSQCVIGGEPINVDGAKDQFVVAPCCVLPHGGKDGSAGAGLYNLRGTTSYMTATIQCLNRVPELKSALTEWRPLFETSSDHLLTAATRDLFEQLDDNAGPVAPRVFLQLFEEIYPTLGQMDNHNPKDAQACWGQLLDTISRSLESTSFPSEKLGIVNELFDIKLVSRVHCQESSEEPPEEKSVRMLEWSVSSMVDYLHNGLRNFLESGLDEASPLCIGGLPRYLSIRFFHTGQRANDKINLLDVDVYNLCSDELRAKLEKARKRLSNGAVSKPETELTGVYRLVAILAHNETPQHDTVKSPGHYAAFLKPEKRSNRKEPFWIQYMDENVFKLQQKHVTEILRGDGSFAPYICLYRAVVVKQKTSA